MGNERNVIREVRGKNSLGLFYDTIPAFEQRTLSRDHGYQGKDFNPIPFEYEIEVVNTKSRGSVDDRQLITFIKTATRAPFFCSICMRRLKSEAKTEH
jgi:hypothetical protein